MYVRQEGRIFNYKRKITKGGRSLGGCLCFCACGQENVEPSSGETPAPLEWEDVLTPDGTIDRDKYSQYVIQGIPEADPGKEEVPENVILLGAMVSDYQYIKKQITAFNLAQSDYQVQVQRYESADAMLLDLVRGQGCDLLALTPGYLETLADKGSLEELGPYLEQSGSVNREELFGAVLEAGTAGGRLVGILPGFNVRTILVEKGYTRDGRRLDCGGVSGADGQISRCAAVRQRRSGIYPYVADE